MNDHTKRIVRRISAETSSYLQGEFDKRVLLTFVEAHIGGIEDKYEAEKLLNFVGSLEALFYTNQDEKIIKHSWLMQNVKLTKKLLKEKGKNLFRTF